MTVRPVIASDGVPYLQMTSVGSQNRLRRENEGKDGDGEIPLQ
jgi:hypothetical protein